MLRQKSEPTRPEVYARFAPLLSAMWFLSIAGSAFSGLTEWRGFASDKMAETYPFLYPLLGVFLIEISWRYLLPALAETAFDMKRNFEKWMISTTILLLVVAILVGIVSINKSKEGIKHKAEEEFAFQDNYSVDSTKYLLLCEGCINEYKSDSSAAMLDAKKLYQADIDKAQREKTKAKNRIAEIAHVTAQWGINTVTQKTAIINAKKAEVEDLKTKIKEVASDSLVKATSTYSDCMKRATDTLLYYTNITEAERNGDKSRNEQEKRSTINTNNLLMYGGVFFVALFSFFRAYVFDISGIKVTYKLSAADNTSGFWNKLGVIVKAHTHNFGEAIIGSLGVEIDVIDEEVKVRKKDNIEAEEDVLDEELRQEKEKVETQKRMLEKRKAAEAEIQALKEQHLKMKQELEAERLALAQQREKAKIEYEQNMKQLKLKAAQDLERAKQEKLKQEIAMQQEIALQQEKLKQEKEKMQQEQEKLQQEKLKQERERALQQEKEKLKQAEQERLKQKKTAKEAAILAEKAKQEKIKREKQEAQIKQDIATAKAKNKTGNNSQQSVSEADIEALFESCFNNGVLVNKRKLVGNIRNFYKRWQDATRKIKEPLSDKRRQQIATGLSNNKLKYELSVETGKEYGLTIKDGEIINS